MIVVPKAGTFQAGILENPQIGLPPSLFYSLAIPVELFDTHLSYEPNPVITTFDLDALQLTVPDWRKLDGQTFVLGESKSGDALIDLGGFANAVVVEHLRFTRLYDVLFRVECRLFCDFETWNVRPSESVELSADLVFTGLYLNFDQTTPTSEYRAHVTRLIDASAYHFGHTPLVNRQRISPAL